MKFIKNTQYSREWYALFYVNIFSSIKQFYVIPKQINIQIQHISIDF